LVNYRDRSGRQVKNDDNDHWMEPAFSQMHRVLKDGGACLSFYAWNNIDRLFPHGPALQASTGLLTDAAFGAA
jgi:DNA modification methylase